MRAVETEANGGLLSPRHGRSAKRYVSQQRLLRSTQSNTTRHATVRLCHGLPTLRPPNDVTVGMLARLHICRQRIRHCTTTLTTCNSGRASERTVYDSTWSMVTLLVHPQTTRSMSHCAPRHILLDTRTESSDDGCTTQGLLEARSAEHTSLKTNGRPRLRSQHQSNSSMPMVQP